MNITTINGGSNQYVHIEGLESLMRFLRNADPKLKKAMQKGLKEAVSPVLERARSKAWSIADDGTYASSLSIASRKNGVEYVLKSTDVAAGVKEFARPGARYKPKSTDRRRNARNMSSFPVGVPHRANKPRAMVPAVEESQQEVIDRISVFLERALEEAHNG